MTNTPDTFQTYKIQSVEPLTDTLLKIIAIPKQLPGIQYEAGQYVMLKTSMGEARPFSIANAPLGTSQLEFHIRHTPDNSYTACLLDDLKQNGILNVSNAHGQCIYHLVARPLLMIAGGTGFAPMKALIEHSLTHDTPRNIHLFWGAQSFGELYMHELAERWQSLVEHFSYTPILPPHSKTPENWHGSFGLLQNIIPKHYPTFDEFDVHIAGSPEMAQTIVSKLKPLGLANNQTFSDVLFS